LIRERTSFIQACQAARAGFSPPPSRTISVLPVSLDRKLAFTIDRTHAPQGLSKESLWDSQAQNYPFQFPKFNVGVVSGAKFVLPRYDGGMDVLGLA
jgi:hypothetical protein